MSMRKSLFLFVFLFSPLAYAQSPNLGVLVTHEDLAAWNINVLPDGRGLPQIGRAHV